MVSQGVPMILGGDEFLRTQHGNNNAWCQDNPTELGRLVAARAKRRTSCGSSKMMIAFRKAHPILRRRTFFTGGAAVCRRRSSGTASSPPSPTSLATAIQLAFALDGRRSDRPNLIDRDIYVAMNAYREPLNFRIPAAPSGRPWRRVVDTALPSPQDIVAED